MRRSGQTQKSRPGVLAAFALASVAPATPDLLTPPASPTTAPSTRPVPQYVCRRAAHAPAIDGRLDDPAWKAAPWSTDFVDLGGRPDRPPRLRTRFKMLWDDRCFYVAAELTEPHVWATQDQRDAPLYLEDAYELFIDPDGDRQNYAELQVSPLNTVWDLLLTRPWRERGKGDSDWTIDGLKTAVAVRGSVNDPTDQDEGWSVEIAIPWQALRSLAPAGAPPADGQTWRINCVRVDWPEGPPGGLQGRYPKSKPDYWAWSPADKVDTHLPELWGFVRFSIKPPGDAPQDLGR